MTTDDARTAQPRDQLAPGFAPSTSVSGPYSVSLSVRADARPHALARVDVATAVVVPRARLRLEGPAFAPASLTPPLAGTLFAAIAPGEGGTAWEWWVALTPDSPFMIEAPLAALVPPAELTLRLLAGDEELLSWTPAPTPIERLPA